MPARGCCSRPLPALRAGDGRLFVEMHSRRGNRPGPPGLPSTVLASGVVEKLLRRLSQRSVEPDCVAAVAYSAVDLRWSIGEPGPQPPDAVRFIRALTPPARLRIAASRAVEVGEGSETGQAAWRQSAVCGTGSEFGRKHGELAGDHCPRRLPRGTRRGRGSTTGSGGHLGPSAGVQTLRRHGPP